MLVMILSVVSVYIIDASLLVDAGGQVTVDSIRANTGIFRWGIVAVVILYAGVSVLSVALYSLLNTVSKRLALLGLVLRSSEAVLGAAAVLPSLAVALLLDGRGEVVALGPDQLSGWVSFLLELRVAALDVILVFTGLGGAVFGYLFLASKCVPRLLALWGVATYLSVLGLALVSIVWPSHPSLLETIVYVPGGGFELFFGGWLLLKGVNAPGTARKVPGSLATPQLHLWGQG